MHRGEAGIVGRGQIRRQQRYRETLSTPSLRLARVELIVQLETARRELNKFE